MRSTLNQNESTNELYLRTGKVDKLEGRIVNVRCLIWPVLLGKGSRHIGDTVSFQNYVRSRAKAYSGLRCLYYSNTTATTQFALLKLSGNVEVNPGPSEAESGKVVCLVCKNTLRKNHNGIKCSSCSGMSHAKCSGLSTKALRCYREFHASWYCTACTLPQFSDSFFEESSDTSTIFDDNLEDVVNCVAWFTSNISSYYKSNIKIAYLNINSIQNMLDEVKDMLNRNLFDIMFIAETKIDNSFSGELLIQTGYRLIRRDRKKGARGLVAHVREDLSVH